MEPMENLEKLMTATELKNQDWLKYANTILLAIIMTISVLAFAKISKVSESQELTSDRQIEIITKQSITIKNVENLDARVKVLELGTVNDMKKWTEDNFVRKPQ